MKLLNDNHVCKPLNDREVKFYQNTPKNLLQHVPKYLGTVQIQQQQQQQLQHDGQSTSRWTQSQEIQQCVYDLSQMWAPNMSFIKVIALYGFMQSCYLLDCFTCGLSDAWREDTDVPSPSMFSLMITASQFCWKQHYGAMICDKQSPGPDFYFIYFSHTHDSGYTHWG